MSRPIMVPLDGSEFAEHALPVAAGLARSLRAPVALVRVHVPVARLENRSGVPALEWWWEESRKAEQAYLEERAAAVQARFRVRTGTHLLYGGVSRVLTALVQRLPARLVVMTTHGRGGLGRIWLGSTADGLIRESTAPVLLVRPSEAGEPESVVWRGFEHVLIAVDGSKRSESMVSEAMAVGGPDARYTLLRVAKPVVLAEPHPLAHAEIYRVQVESHTKEARRYVEDLAARLRPLGSAVASEVVAEVPVAQGIIQSAERQGADLIALATRGRSGWARFAVGSVADRVIRGSRLPVLILGPKVIPPAAVAAAGDRTVAEADAWRAVGR